MPKVKMCPLLKSDECCPLSRRPPVSSNHAGTFGYKSKQAGLDPPLSSPIAMPAINPRTALHALRFLQEVEEIGAANYLVARL